MLDTLIFACIILVLDIPWIYYVMSNQYQKVFAEINIPLSTDLIAASMAYILMISSYPLFISKQPTSNRVRTAGLLGFLIYGIYAFTLKAILKQYPFELAIGETIWGTVLFSISTLLTQIVIKRFNI